MTNALRGQVYWVDVGGSKGTHPYVVVSHNDRNRKLDSVLAVMVTSDENKRVIPTAVPMTHDDPVSGFAMADILEELYEDEVSGTPGGVLSPRTLLALNAALKIALAIP